MQSLCIGRRPVLKGAAKSVVFNGSAICLLTAFVIPLCADMSRPYRRETTSGKASVNYLSFSWSMLRGLHQY